MTTLRLSTDLDHGRAYPRPQLVRQQWLPLNGKWRFALDPDAAWRLPDDVVFDRQIEVPFSPEAPASGVGETGFYCAVWYARDVQMEPVVGDGRVLLHFGAVDYETTVWVNGSRVGEHEGGYTPFAIDITDALVPGPTQRIVVRAYDDPQDLAKPRGKQDWQLNPHSIWYPRTTGIWQTVWIERVPPSWICRLRWTPNLERWEIGFEAEIEGMPHERLRLRVRLTLGDMLIADDTYAVVGGSVHRRAVRSGHRRLPERAALEPAHAAADRRGDRALGRSRGATRRRAELYRASRRRGPGRSLHAERPAVPAPPRPRPGVLAVVRADGT